MWFEGHAVRQLRDRIEIEKQGGHEVVLAVVDDDTLYGELRVPPNGVSDHFARRALERAELVSGRVVVSRRTYESEIAACIQRRVEYGVAAESRDFPELAIPQYLAAHVFRDLTGIHPQEVLSVEELRDLASAHREPGARTAILFEYATSVNSEFPRDRSLRILEEMLEGEKDARVLGATLAAIDRVRS